MGLSTEEGVSANAASWKAPTILPLVIHPRLPPTEESRCECELLLKLERTFRFVFGIFLCNFAECLTLLSISWINAGVRNRVRTQSTLIFSKASVAFECFSQRICRTFIELAALRALFPFQATGLNNNASVATTHLRLLLKIFSCILCLYLLVVGGPRTLLCHRK